MTDEQLAAIKARHNKARQHAVCDGSPEPSWTWTAATEFANSSLADVPTLVAEVERLRKVEAALSAVRDAINVGPFPPWISDDVNEFGERECFGCQRHGVEGEHAPRCRFGPISAAIRATESGE